MKRLLLIALVAAPLAVSANTAFKDCSTKASKMTSKTELQALAKITPEQAKTAALAEANGATIVKGGIETENGCLVYSYHVKAPNMKGQTEVIVDAGNGKILEREQEGAARAALEKPIDKTKELASRTKEKLSGEPRTTDK